jgi:RNA polymerase sigma-70 factor (ECF subfamily)
MLNFKDLYESYSAEVYRFALWLAGDSSEAEDITSETFIRAWVNNSNIRTETLKAYLFTIARNIYLEQLRKRKRQVSLDPTYPDPGPEPERVVESQIELLRIKPEIARVLGISLAAAKVKVHRVRKKILALNGDEEVY